jgi:hypothetical protein
VARSYSRYWALGEAQGEAREASSSRLGLFELRKNRSHGKTEKKASNVSTRYAPCGVVRIWGPVPAIPKLDASPIAQARRATTGHHQRRGVPLEKLTRTKPSPAPFTESTCVASPFYKSLPMYSSGSHPIPSPFPKFFTTLRKRQWVLVP